MTEAMTAASVSIVGAGDDEIEAYLARPTDQASRGGIVVLHHLPGFDAATKEIARRFAAHGYDAIVPNLHHREAPGGDPDDAAAAVRAAGGVPDERLIADAAGARDYLRALPGAGAKTAVIGYCSGGRQAFLAASALPFDAAIVCYGAFIAPGPASPSGFAPTPLLDRAGTITGVVLGLFGEEDSYPSPDQVALIDAALTNAGVAHEFHTYPNAGHGFFAPDRVSYRVEAANAGWAQIWTFLAGTLGG